MTRRLLIAAALGCAIVALVPLAAAARGERRSDIPACEELMTTKEAAEALREPYAFIVLREVVGETRNCDYSGGQKGSVPRRTLAIQWGPWADLRKRLGAFAKKQICPVSMSACRDAAKAAKAKRDLDSFKSLESALGAVGVTTRLRTPVFEGNPAVAWRPREATGMSDFAWVFLYDVNTSTHLVTFCIDNTVRTPDAACAIAAAELVYTNIK